MFQHHARARRTRIGRTAKSPRLSDTLEQLEGRCLLSRSGRIWLIAGDTNPQDLSDEIIIDRDPSNPATLRGIVNGEIVVARPAARIKEIHIVSGAGDDTVRVDESLGSILARMTVRAGTGDDYVEGASGNDLLDGQDGQDTLVGGAGDDRLRGGNGPNRLEGGAGSDDLRGGSENDTLWGGDGDDRLEGLGGRDRLYGSDGRDTLLGGFGDDTLVGNGGDPTSPSGATIRSATSTTASIDSDVLDGGLGDNVIIAEDGEDVIRNGRTPEDLEHLGSCADIAARLIDQAMAQYKWFFDGSWGRPGGIYLPLDNVRFDSFSASILSSLPVGGSGSSDPSHSNTNTQELGVDEADIVKTDGNFMYILRGQELIIVDTLPADKAEVVSRTEIEGYPMDLFLSGQRVMIFSTVYGGSPGPLPVEPLDALRLVGPIWFRGEPQVKITVLDVSDRAEPHVLHESFLDGAYVNSRMVDGQVYVVLDNSPRFPVPWMLYATDGIDIESPEHFRERLLAADPMSFLPQFRSLDYLESGTTERSGDMLLDCGSIYKTAVDDWMSLTTVMSFDLDAETIGGPRDSATVIGSISTVYASTDSLYLVNQNWHESGPVTGVHKLALGDDLRVEASGEVPGTVLNQFSMDEEGPYFRIATTSQGLVSDRWEVENNVYILTEQGDTLDVVGSIEGLAPNERIFATRFFSDHGFVVTFRQVDPLFALDLSDPTDPRVAGELKVNGFSRYLHPVGEDHLLAIGRDADEAGRVRGLQVSLFDVSDLDNPTLVDQYLIQQGESWNWSAAEWDHHAFSYFPETGVMAVPVDGTVRIDPVDDGNPETIEWPTWEHHSNFWVFHVDPKTGFELLGQVGHESTALRGVRINDALYTLAYDDLKIQALLTPADTIQKISLQ